jgi:hypothetical protein
LLGKESTGGVAVGEGAIGVSSGSSKTNSYSVIKRENTGAGIFNVGEKTIPTIISDEKWTGPTIPNRHFVFLGACHDSFEMSTYDAQ